MNKRFIYKGKEKMGRKGVEGNLPPSSRGGDIGPCRLATYSDNQ